MVFLSSQSINQSNLSILKQRPQLGLQRRPKNPRICMWGWHAHIPSSHTYPHMITWYVFHVRICMWGWHIYMYLLENGTYIHLFWKWHTYVWILHIYVHITDAIHIVFFDTICNAFLFFRMAHINILCLHYILHIHSISHNTCFDLD